MYIPSKFEEKRTEVLQQFIREHALGTLVTLGSDGLNANHVPFEIDPDAAPLGVLRAHVARSNPVWQDCAPGIEPLVVFQGPRAYITPSWYATKKENERVVPTYNYMVVHAYGSLRVIDDPVWVRAQLERLTNQHEAGRPQPWKVSDAPAKYIRKLSMIIGIEITMTKMIGQWKVSQDEPAINRVGVEQGLREAGGENAIAMADAVARR